jgi:Tfp pilus assembly protein PilF
VNRTKIIYAVSGLLIGFLIGFFFSNTINRRENEALRAQFARVQHEAQIANDDARQNATTTNKALTEDEIHEAIATTDARPADIYLQRNFGAALYRYASENGHEKYLTDAARMLKRASDNDPKDYELTVMLANALFDIAQKNDPASVKEARQYYAQALQMRPNDANVRMDYGLTFYLAQPSDPQRAIAEYRRALAADPQHELTLQNLAIALLSVGNVNEAQKRVDELEKVNATNLALPNLRTQLAQSKIENQN